MKVRFLSWNLDERNLAGPIAKLCGEQEVDVLVLMELSSTWLGATSAALGELERPLMPIPAPGCSKVALFSRLQDCFEPGPAETRYTTQLLKPPGCIEVIVGATHGLDARNHSLTARADDMDWLRKAIEGLEDKQGHHMSLVVGDLNMNPYDAGIHEPSHFFATMSGEEAVNRPTRSVNHREKRRFYNPSWRLMGSSLPYGTHYYDANTGATPYWNTFDQVLLRPDLVGRFNEGAFTFISMDPFVDEEGRPRKVQEKKPVASGAAKPVKKRKTKKKKKRRSLSDHLPLLFELDLIER